MARALPVGLLYESTSLLTSSHNFQKAVAPGAGPEPGSWCLPACRFSLYTVCAGMPLKYSVSCMERNAGRKANGVSHQGSGLAVLAISSRGDESRAGNGTGGKVFPVASALDIELEE